MAKEPILRHREAGVIVEHADKKLTVPERDGAVREGRAADEARKSTVDAGYLVLEILRLLAVVAL